MEISWLGQSCFKIKGKKATIVTDPYSREVGFALPKIEANIVTVSHNHFDHNFVEGVAGKPFVISGPGEHEIAGISVLGLLTNHDKAGGAQRGKNTIYLIEIDGLRICHLGDLGEDLLDEILDRIDGVDILLIPVGGTYTINSSEASELISKIDPKVIIPMHYRIEGLTISELDPVDKFCKEIGVCKTPVPNFVVKAEDLSEKEEEVVILQRSKR